MNVAEIEGLQQQVAQLRARDLTHEELGTTNGFHDVESAKNSLAEYLGALLSLSRDLFDSLDPIVVTTSLNVLSGRLSEFNSLANTIDQFVQQGVSTPGYPGQRTSYIDDFKARGHTARQQLQQFELYLRIAAIERRTRPEVFEGIASESAQLLANLRAAATEATKILDNVRDKVLVKGIQDARGTFEALAAGHAQREQRWFVALIVGAVATALGITAVLLGTVSVGTVPAVVIVIFKRLLLISALAVFLRVALAKYNAERNLRIIYAHRETVIAQFRTFESAIGDSNAEAKNQLRLEIAKYIFTDPVTGYLSAESADINISPVISTIEKVASRGTA